MCFGGGIGRVIGGDSGMICNDTRACCFRNRFGTCDILTSGYPDGKCPFAKANREDPSYTTIKLRHLRKGGGLIGAGSNQAECVS